MHQNPLVDAPRPDSSSNYLSPPESQRLTTQSQISPTKYPHNSPHNGQLLARPTEKSSKKASPINPSEPRLKSRQGSSPEADIQKNQPNKDAFQRKSGKGDEEAPQRQKYQETLRGKPVGRRDNPHSAQNENENSEEFVLSQRQFQERGKKQQKKLKKNEKERVNYSQLNEKSNYQNEKATSKSRQVQSPQLLSIFQQKYPYYLIGRAIAFPIQDSLFLSFPELRELNTGRSHGGSKIHYELQQLSGTFSSELQIWNILKEHPAFFQHRQDLSLQDVALVLKSQQSDIFGQLFKSFHFFFLRDVIHHKYDEFSSEEHYSFISLWKYAEENSLLDKIFGTCWNKLIQLYIAINKNTYNDPKIKSINQQYAEVLRKDMSSGKFSPPQEYQKLLEYFLFLIDMCFETATFRNLINDKMLFFRDNNKMKNQLLEEKKDIEGLLWEIKEEEKGLAKKEKAVIKAMKKQPKSAAEATNKCNSALEEVESKRNEIINKREAYLSEITSIQNSIYELSCMPEFSNVWFLGQDRFRNLYWFIKDNYNCIFRQSSGNGAWSKITHKNIDLFQGTLNLRGIKEKKLYEKITYYKQLGYLKTAQQGQNSQVEKSQIQKQSNKPYDNCAIDDGEVREYSTFSASQVEAFSYLGYKTITPAVIKILILKSELMMAKYLYQRNSKWTSQQNRQLYLARINQSNLDDLEALTQDLRMFNERICVVQINIKPSSSKTTDGSDASKTRKIQTKIWGINEKYKHFWYDYSRKCKTLSDLYFLVSILFLTIEKYVTKTRKPNNTKYFYKTVEFGETGQMNENYCSYCQTMGELQNCSQCDMYLHSECLTKHESTQCIKRKEIIE